jgi:hypothetical protein
LTEEQSLRLSVLAIAGRHDDWRERAEAMLAWVRGDAAATVTVLSAVRSSTSWTFERIALLHELAGQGVRDHILARRMNALPGKELSVKAVSVRRRRMGVFRPVSDEQRAASSRNAAVARAARAAKVAKAA